MSGSNREHAAIIDCCKRAVELKQRLPVPPALGYREIHLEEVAGGAAKATSEMQLKEEDALSKIKSGGEKKNVSLIAWGAATLDDLIDQMEEGQPRWEDHEIDTLRPHVERAKQEITQYFHEWLSYQAPRGDTPDAVGDFKHKMLRQTGGSLKALELDSLAEELEKQVAQIIRNAETAAEARQLVRDVRSWQLTHRDAHSVVRVADGRALLDVGREYTSKLQGMSQRIQLQELGEVRTQLSQFLIQVKEAIEQIVKRAERLWNLRLRSAEDMDNSLEEIDLSSQLLKTVQKI